MQIVLFLHSIFRWLILLFALLVLVQGMGGMGGKKPFTTGARKSTLFLMICCDIQLLLGLALYFVNGWWGVLTSGNAMANKGARFFSVEHAFGMLVAIVLVHMANSSTKKLIDDDRKYKRIFWYTLFALIIILATIPWPGREMIGRPMFRSI